MFPRDEFDERFCFFCQDRAPEGRVIFVLQGTQDTVPNAPGAEKSFESCKKCGFDYTDAVIGTNEKGETAVFQFEHQDYHKVTEDQHASLVAQFEENECSVCGLVLWPDENQKVMSTADLVTKMLRQEPSGITLSMVCGRCTELGLCPDCDEDHDHG